ncbi:MAG: PhoH family protein [Clostridia bacterium]|nr:PhoH family protein [Clostridia bacterium]
MSQHKKIINLPSAEVTSRMFGPFDANVTLIERAFAVVIRNRHGGAEGEDAISVEGNDARGVEQAVQVLETVRTVAKQGDAVPEQSVRYIIDMVRAGEQSALSDMSDDCICVTTRGKPIKAKTVGQRRYVNAIRKNTIIFGVGPAGTGKTFLAVAMAVKALRDKQVSRIILTRPAIEAGERLGFLPGDLQSKIDPYLRPLYDALFEMMGPENYQHCVEKQTIEVAPLAYMRGRTLDDSFIILDEAQNATPEQMKMFLTRLGFNSKAVITGDLTQTDLPHGTRSGLSLAVKILQDIEDISIHHFTERDVVRHHLVQKIIQAYDRFENERRAENEKRGESFAAKKFKKN